MNKIKKDKKSFENSYPQWFYLVLILLPFLFVILLEISLRVINYGDDIPQWISVTEDKLTLNPLVAKRYFSNLKDVPGSDQDYFLKNKKPASYRIFVLGGSSAAGFPFIPNGSFSRYLKKRLEIYYPETYFEIVNVSMSAVNSYTLLDLLPGILEQQPDLILIYAGHNEYYGALGIGSMESLGTSRFVVKLLLKLQHFRTFQLIRNVIRAILEITVNNNIEDKAGTLMSKIVKDKFIKYKSDSYYEGLDQFKNNLEEIIELSKEKNVNIILSTVTSNRKDQKPFITTEVGIENDAQKYFNLGQNEFANGNFEKAGEYFNYAKDYDEIRFRAPEDINNIIIRLKLKYNLNLVNIDSVFKSKSRGRIIGNNLMTDHLHPTLNGYKLMAKAFFENIKNNIPIKEKSNVNLSLDKLDSLNEKNFLFSEFDSVVADFTIKSLKNDWPFIRKENKKAFDEIFSLNNFVDSIAMDFLNKKYSWELAHRKVAERYLQIKDFKNFKTNMDIIIEEYPWIVKFYDIAAEGLLINSLYDDAFPYLIKRYNLEKDAYSSKWIGIILLSKNKTDEAINYLITSLNYYSSDVQVLYNLAGAYSIKRNYKKALETITKCLKIKSNFAPALRLKSQLLKAMGS